MKPFTLFPQLNNLNKHVSLINTKPVCILSLLIPGIQVKPYISSSGQHQYAVNYGGRISSKGSAEPLWSFPQHRSQSVSWELCSINMSTYCLAIKQLWLQHSLCQRNTEMAWSSSGKETKLSKQNSTSTSPNICFQQN